MNDPRIYRVVIGDGQGIFPVDGLAFDGRLWIVVEWLATENDDWRRPGRMICIDALPHQTLPPDNPFGIDYAVNEAIPRAVLDGTDPDPAARGYVVMRDPPIRIAMPREEAKDKP